MEFFSYVFHFHALMAGPVVFYKDYIDFIHGHNFRWHPHPTDVSQYLLTNLLLAVKILLFLYLQDRLKLVLTLVIVVIIINVMFIIYPAGYIYVNFYF